MTTVADRELELIREYEAQIAVYKVRIELLEQKIKDQAWSLNLAYTSDKLLAHHLTLAGMPIMDVKIIFETLDEWHREGGSDSLIDWLRR